MYTTPHRRLNPLTNEWVLVSPQRTNRPWLGQTEKGKPVTLPHYDPTCSLCPTNTRATGIKNPPYDSTFVFDNDFPALLKNTIRTHDTKTHPLLTEQPETGICKVICFSPRHDITLPDMTTDEVQNVINTWANECKSLGKQNNIGYIQIFENKGAMMGCSNPHPHSQLWATSNIPNEPAKELVCQQTYFKKNKKPLLHNYVSLEIRKKERIVALNKYWVALVPFWANWPFEIMVVSRESVSRLEDCTAKNRKGLAEIIREVTQRYDRLFAISFPYSMGFHQAPYDKKPHPEWILHAHYYPPLLRSANVRKFMVGYEMLASPQRDITPESAAKILREITL